MSLIVFDMGRRVETPVASPRRRISPLSGISRTDAVEQQNDHDGELLTYSRQGQQEHDEHSPQAVALTSDIMIQPVITVESSASIGHAYSLMREHGIHHLPVMDTDHRVLAMVSDRLILRSLVENNASNEDPVIRIAARPVYCTEEDADIRQTAHLLCEYHIGALPVLNDKEQLVGIVTGSDLLHVISDYGPLELWA